MAGKSAMTFRCAAVLTIGLLIVTALVPTVSAMGWLRGTVADTHALLSFIDAGDVNRDGEDEIYAVSLQGKVYKVLYTGNSWSQAQVPGAPDSTESMVIGDMNKDSYDEIYIASKHSADNGRIYRITYTSVTWDQDVILSSFSSSNYPMDLAIGDVNRNGANDLYYIDAGGNLAYMYQSGAMWFSSTIDVQTPGFFRCVAVGDGDGDGLEEIYVGTDTNRIYQYEWEGSMWTQSQVAYGGSDGYWDYVQDVIVGDADEDGNPNVIAVIANSALMMYEYIQGTWSSEEIDDLSEVQSIYQLEMGDGDADGNDELFVAATNNVIYHYYWDTDLSDWIRMDASTGPLPNDLRSLVVAEVDGEPDFMEIYATCYDGRVYRFNRDVDPPPAPNIWSTTHPERVWKNETIVELYWEMPSPDPSGINGFSYSWGMKGTSPPDTTIDLAGDDDDLTSHPLPDGDRIYFGLRAMDGAGNWGKTGYYGPIYIDTAPPTDLKIIIKNDDEFTNTNIVTLKISASDELSGPFNMSFSNDEEHWLDWVPFSNTYSGWGLNPHSQAGVVDGPRYVFLKVQDTAGNVASGPMDDIYLDQSPPTDLVININGGEKYTNETIVGLTVSAVDPTGGSKLAYMSFSNDNDNWSPWELYNNKKPYWDLTKDPGGWDGDGDHRVYFRIKDQADNIGGPVSGTIVLDRVAPSRLEVIINSNTLVAKNTTLSLTLKADDVPDHSGVGHMALKEEGKEWSEWMSFSSREEFIISKGDGVKFVWFKVKDRAGNAAEPVRAFTILDSKTPRISHIRVLGVSDKNAVVSWTTDIPANGIVQYGTSVNYNGEKHHSDLLSHHAVTLSGLRPSTEYHFRVESSDAAGQQPTVSKDMVFTTKDYPDTLPPTITDLKVEGLSSNTAVITWKTNEPADTRLKYGQSAQYGLVEGNSKDILEHRVLLKNLKYDTLYHFAASSSDPRGNGPAEDTGTFMTYAQVDTEAPTISSLKVIGVTDSLAVVKWHTNEPTLGIIEYGITMDHGTVAVCEQYKKVHRVVLTGLQSDTLYHLIVRALDSNDNGPTTSDDVVFFTTHVSDRTPPVLTNVKADSITSNSAVIFWATDEPADSGVEYYSSTGGVGESVYDLDMVETHGLNLYNLKPDTEYTYRVISYDASGNGPSVSADFAFRTSDISDSLAPKISNLTVEGISDRLAVVMWATDEPSTGSVEYGIETGVYTHEVQEEGFLVEHSVVLWGLSPGTAYYLRVHCSDPSGNGPTISDEYGFKTFSDPDRIEPEIVNLKVTNLTHNLATIQWLTDEPSDSEVRFAHGDDHDMVAKDGRFVYAHVMTLQNLEANTTYRFTVLSTDPSGNQGISEELTFTTTAVYIPPITPPPPPPITPGTPSTLEGSGPWIALLLFAILVIGVSYLLYSKGMLTTGGRARRRKGAGAGTSAAHAQQGAVQGHHHGMGMISDDGICPHCRSQISLTLAAREKAEEQEREEERKRKEAEAHRRREEAAAKHRARLDTIERRVGTLSTNRGGTMRTPPTRRGIGPDHYEEAQDDLEGHEPDDEDLDAELEDLYDEVEEEEEVVLDDEGDDEGDDEKEDWAQPVSPIVQELKDKDRRKAKFRKRGRTRKVPVKTVTCGSCGGNVPVFTRERPVRIRCPDCGKSGTLKGK